MTKCEGTTVPIFMNPTVNGGISAKYKSTWKITSYIGSNTVALIISLNDLMLIHCGGFFCFPFWDYFEVILEFVNGACSPRGSAAGVGTLHQTLNLLRCCVGLRCFGSFRMIFKKNKKIDCPSIFLQPVWAAFWLFGHCSIYEIVWRGYQTFKETKTKWEVSS